MSLRVLEVGGTPSEMGRQHGRAFADEIAAFCRERLRLALEDAQGRATVAEALALAEQHLQPHRDYAPDVFDEFAGIADGAGVEPALLLVGNGYTDFRDVLCRHTAGEAHGCTAFIVEPEASADGRLYTGQTWDMQASAEPHMIVVVRRPDRGPASVTLTTTGCLSLVGVNAAGIAVGNTNLKPTDARPGVIYLAMIHHALACESFDEAVDAITSARRASGHNYIVASADGRAVNLETTATRFEALSPADGLLVHTNHYLAETLLPLEGADHPKPSSTRRLARFGTLLAENRGSLDADRLGRLLGDHDGEDTLTVCRHSPDDEAKTCAAVVVDPAGRRLWACQGNPCEGQWELLET